ncbi:hypothetical protein TNCV_1572601 [Trichonephila clavipes]|uniref:Uncharacterized protein n=1 Tax=Trichonephila clavipes TaxID=2585209 RepID=A0A8X6SKK1_TRICX|nr:hypothetical protein TNCV_1572601 [Trichonephila clavipes]
MKMRVLNRSRQNDRLRVMLVQFHIDITPLHTPMSVSRRIGERTIPYSWRAFPLYVSLQTDHLIEASAHVPQRPMVTYTGIVGPGPHGSSSLHGGSSVSPGLKPTTYRP